MQNNKNKKGLVIGIVILFFGASFIPNICGDTGKPNIAANEKKWERNNLRQSLFDRPPVEDWNYTYGGLENDVGYSVQQTKDDGYIIAGETLSYGSGDFDVWLIKTDANGIEQWNRTFGGVGYDVGRSVQQTEDGGYIIIGETRSYDTTSSVWLIKTNANGVELWNRVLRVNDKSRGMSGQQTMDGGFIIIGDTWKYISPVGDDVLLIKTDANGYEEWNRTFGELGEMGPELDCGYDVQQTMDGGYILTGEHSGSKRIPGIMWLIKTDASGNEQWNKTDYDFSRGESVQQTTDGGYIVLGLWYGSGGGEDIHILKTDAYGNQQWTKIINDGWGHCGQQTMDGGYIFAGYTERDGLWLFKTDAGGNEQWNITYGEGMGFSVQQTTDEGYILTGYNNGRDVWLIKVKGEINQPQPPEPPIINGTTSGNAGTSYPYTFTSIDPDGDQVSYYIEWGDGKNTTWTEFRPSGSPGYIESHSWSPKGTYIIQAKAKDIYGAESDWANLTVIMPRTKMSLINRIVDRFPNMFLIIRFLIKY